jgi:hypothetical protein
LNAALRAASPARRRTRSAERYSVMLMQSAARARSRAATLASCVATNAGESRLSRVRDSAIAHFLRRHEKRALRNKSSADVNSCENRSYDQRRDSERTCVAACDPALPEGDADFESRLFRSSRAKAGVCH